jgi:hypothetical protein
MGFFFTLIFNFWDTVIFDFLTRMSAARKKKARQKCATKMRDNHFDNVFNENNGMRIECKNTEVINLTIARQQRATKMRDNHWSFRA